MQRIFGRRFMIATSAAALLAGAALGGPHSPRAEAAAPITGAVGCSMSNMWSTINFPFHDNGLWPAPTIGAAQNPVPGAVPATLGAAGSATVLCGVALADFKAFFNPSPNWDTDSATIDGGTVSFSVSSTTGNIIIQESGATSFASACGNKTPPGGKLASGLESCLGAVATGSSVSVNPGNTVHLVRRPGTPPPFGAGQSFTICASYQRYASLGPAASIGPVCHTGPLAAIILFVPLP